VKIEETSRPRAKVTELWHKEDDIGGAVGRGVGLVVVVSSSEEVVAIVVVVGGGKVVVEVGTVAPPVLAIVATELISLDEFDVVAVVAGAINATQPTLVSASPSAQHEPEPNPAQ